MSRAVQPKKERSRKSFVARIPRKSFVARAMTETHTGESQTSAWQENHPSNLDDELRILLLLFQNTTCSRSNKVSADQASKSIEIRPSLPPPQRFARRVRTCTIVPFGPSKALMTDPSPFHGTWEEVWQTAPTPEGPSDT